MKAFNPSRGEGGTLVVDRWSAWSPRWACSPPACGERGCGGEGSVDADVRAGVRNGADHDERLLRDGLPGHHRSDDCLHKQYPTAKWNIREDPFATITQDAPLTLGGPNPPDLMRLPTIGGLVKDGVLKNLDAYFNEYHWNKFPASQLAQLRTSPSGVGVGSGPLYAMGINYSLTGVFYNKALAEKIGMTSAPKTLAELDADWRRRRRPGSRRSSSSTAARPAACCSRSSS